MTISPVLGVDIGGSHITSALVNLDHGQPVDGSLSRLAVNSSGSVDEILDSWSEAIRRTVGERTFSQIPIGIAMPGPFDYDNGICLIREQKKFKSLYGLGLKELLASRLGTDESLIYFMNDACAFLEGEMMGGAGRGYPDVMGITLGTGLGSAFSRNGHVTDADLWNSPFRDGVAEDLLSTRWFTNRFEELTGKRLPGVKELVALADSEPAAETVFAEFGKNLAAFMTSLSKEHRYQKFIIGGNISKAGRWFTPHCDEHLGITNTFINYGLAELGENAPLIGAGGMAARINASGRSTLDVNIAKT